MATVPSTYSRQQMILHWVIAALVAFQIFFHGGIERQWDERMSGAVPNVATPNIHAIAGVLIFVLMLWRVWLRVRRGAPAMPAGEPRLLRALARLTHGAFYLLLLGMPAVGASAWFGGNAVPAQIHVVAAYVLIVLIVVHIAAALAHRFWFRTDVLKRMTSF